MKKIILVGLSILSLNAFAQIGVNTPNPQGVFHLDGKSSPVTTNPNTGTPTATQLEDDVVIKSTGAVGIGTTPNDYAMLDVAASDKGILIPRVSLTSSTMDIQGGDGSSQPTGLMVYNNGTTLPKGYYFWNGSTWMSIDSTNSIAPQVNSITCSSAVLSPSAWKAGVPYEGNLKISYSGGNGGAYSEGNPITINGLTFVLRPGKLEYGAGELVFSVTGTPVNTSDMILPINSTIVPFLTAAQQCDARIMNQTTADIKVLASMGSAVYDDISDSYVFPLSTPDGRYRVRVRIATPDPTKRGRSDVQLFNNTGSAQTLIWNYSTDYGGLIVLTSSDLAVPANVWGGTNSSGANSWKDSGTGNNTDGFWGDPDINNAVGSGPEYRRYTWTDYNSNVMYTAYVMLASKSGGSVYPTNDTKIYIKIEQVTAL
ncbi:hypothetical protein [Myroides indicus]|uniref:Uncharacterized protein n=1 Tax=Myroides indicus TaxID=1323422 RepID=A0A4R7EYF5_9FLAO|nr:hypothetical protein [Myroides indicus]TDS56862.1 hypothetical protein C8P70_11810 [Myroides indicus]